MTARLGLVAGAVLLGVLSATGWRLDVGLVNALAGLQAVWALGAWLSGWLHAGRPGRGAVAGGLFGLLAMAAYYLTEVAVDSVHSATSQLAASGRFWVPAAVLGGLAFGAIGTWGPARSAGRWVEPAAFSHAAMAAALLAEAVFVVVALDRFAEPQPIVEAAGVLVVLALGLVVSAWRRAGGRALLLAAVLAAVATPVGAAAFLLLEHRFGYVTI